MEPTLFDRLVVSSSSLVLESFELSPALASPALASPLLAAPPLASPPLAAPPEEPPVEGTQANTCGAVFGSKLDMLVSIHVLKANVST